MKTKLTTLLVIVFILFLGDFERQKSLFKDIFTNGIHIYGLQVQKKCLSDKVDYKCLEDSLLIKDELIYYINNLNVQSKYTYNEIKLHLVKKNDIKSELNRFGLNNNLIKDYGLPYFEKYKIFGFPTILKKYSRYLFFKENNKSYLHKNFEDSFDNIDAIYIAEVPMKSFLKLYVEKRGSAIIFLLVLLAFFCFFSKKSIKTPKLINFKHSFLIFIIFFNFQALLVRLFTNSDIVINEIPMDNYFFWVHDKMNEKYTELTLFLLLLISSFLFIVINLKFKIIDNLVEKKEKLNNLILVLIALFSLYRLANSSKFVSYEIIVYSLLLYISLSLYRRKSLL